MTRHVDQAHVTVPPRARGLVSVVPIVDGALSTLFDVRPAEVGGQARNPNSEGQIQVVGLFGSQGVVNSGGVALQVSVHECGATHETLGQRQRATLTAATILLTTLRLTPTARAVRRALSPSVQLNLKISRVLLVGSGDPGVHDGLI